MFVDSCPAADGAAHWKYIAAAWKYAAGARKYAAGAWKYAAADPCRSTGHSSSSEWCLNDVSGVSNF